MKSIKVGVIGCGAVLERCHLPAVKGISGIKVKALADVNEKRMEWIMEKFNLKDAYAYTDYRRLLRNADVDAVWILTPPKLHARMVADALKNGKHVFCEKPIATCVKDIEIIEEARKQNFRKDLPALMPAHNFIFTPCFERAVECIRRGLIGEIKKVYGRAVSNLSFYKAVTDFRTQAKGGVIEDQLPHAIYLAQDLCGSMVKVRSIKPHSSRRTLIEDVDVEVEFQNGVKGFLSAAWSNSIPAFKFEIKGDSGVLSMDLLRTPFNLTLVRDGRRKVIHMGHRFTQYFNVLLGKHPSYRREHLHFIDLVRESAEPRISVEKGFELARALESIMRRLDGGVLQPRSRRERVSIVRVRGSIKESAYEAIRLLGGLKIPRGINVVIKPNICFWKNTDGMIITDPRLLRAVLEMVKERTNNVLVVESDNNSGTAEKRLRRSGVMEVIEECGAEFLNLSRDKYEEHEVAGLKIKVPKTVLEAEYFINIPKIKTCNIANTVISISMKNMFGVLGNKKKMVFHKRLLDVLLYLNRVIRQDLVIVDGIIGMEGLGPVWGKPVKLGLIVSGFNPIAVDAVCCKIMDINPYSVELLWRAYRMKMGEIDVERIEVLGERIEDVKKRFSRPTLLTNNIIGAIRAALKTYIGGA